MTFIETKKKTVRTSSQAGATELRAKPVDDTAQDNKIGSQQGCGAQDCGHDSGNKVVNGLSIECIRKGLMSAERSIMPRESQPTKPSGRAWLALRKFNRIVINQGRYSCRPIEDTYFCMFSSAEPIQLVPSIWHAFHDGMARVAARISATTSSFNASVRLPGDSPPLVPVAVQ